MPCTSGMTREHRPGLSWSLNQGCSSVRSSHRTTPKENTSAAVPYSCRVVEKLISTAHDLYTTARHPPHWLQCLSITMTWWTMHTVSCTKLEVIPRRPGALAPSIPESLAVQSLANLHPQLLVTDLQGRASPQVPHQQPRLTEPFCWPDRALLLIVCTRRSGPTNPSRLATSSLVSAWCMTGSSPKSLSLHSHLLVTSRLVDVRSR